MYESQSGSVRIRYGHLATSYSWSKSDDGSAANAVILDTSSDKYTVVDGNSLENLMIIILLLLKWIVVSIAVCKCMEK